MGKMKTLATISLIGTCFVSAGFAHSLQSSIPTANEARGNQQQVPFAMSAPGSAPGKSGGPIMADVLASERKISIFAGLIRDVDPVSKRLQDGKSNMTILAPLNAELSKMTRKPWEDPEEYNALGADAYQGGDGEARAQKNLRKFVEAHIVPQSPLKPGAKVSTLAGTTVQLEENKGKNVIQPGGIEVDGVADVVANGQIWMIRGVLPRT